MPKTSASPFPAAAILRVAVPAPVYGCFDYLPPAGMDVAGLQPGMRLLLPFGRRRIVGVLTEITTHSEFASGRLRHAIALLDETPALDREILGLCQWAAAYYHHPLGEVIAAALPKLLRVGRAARAEETLVWRLSPEGLALDPATLKRAPKQQALLHHLRALPAGADETLLRDELGEVRTALKALQARGLIAQVRPDVVAGIASSEVAPAANAEQALALARIGEGLGSYAPFLLEGVTGSGKTEVYLQAIAQVVARGQQALVLAPEIGLTPQLVGRFRARLGERLAISHSGLTDSDRLAAWLAAREGRADVVIGTRSALFTPMPRLGLIIVDEEHDGSYKQQDGFRYSARDLAIRRAQQAKIPIVLGSATPSLESLHNAMSGRYRTLPLNLRAGEAAHPEIRLLDIRGQALFEGLSAALLAQMKRHLDAGGQALLFLNRRGFAPTLMCHSCGWVADCKRCDAHMTLHAASRRLRCHHCGAERPIDRSCPTCQSQDIIAIGQGTERVEQALREKFPDVGIARIDRDTTRRKGELDRLLGEVRSGEARILIGTQMLAKGHDFPDVTFAGILNADGGLFGTDFRAAEHMAQLVTQVAGRAGRAGKPGEVYIQTHHPQHALLTRLIRDGYRAFAEAALAERRETGLPPFGHLALLRAESPQAASATAFLEQAAGLIRDRLPPAVELWGPVPAPMERRAGRVRAQLLLQARARAPLHSLLRSWVPQLDTLPGARKARWSLDVDPYDLF